MMLAFLMLAQVTYQRDIAPIISRNCVPCHTENNVAPFPLTNYREVQRHARQIVDVTRSRYMPPWLPAGDSFKDPRRLTSHQINLLRLWSQSGTPEGAAAAHDKPVERSASLGKPDLILSIAQPYTLPAEGPDTFRNFVIPVPSGAVHFVRAIELDPGNPKLVHHASIILDRARTLRARDYKDRQPGFPGMDLTTESGNTFDPDSHFLFWKPGAPAEEEPPSRSWRLDPDTDLILNLHLRPSGKPEQILPKVAIYFAEAPPTEFPMLLQLEHDGVIDIPANSRDFTVTDHLTLPVAVDLLRIYPHAHYLGRKIEAWAKLPGGVSRNLIEIPNWDLNWQGVFTYRDPIHLPKGTILNMRIAYDNTAANPRNPNSPPIQVRTGDRGSDEMGHVWFQVLPSNPGPSDARLALQETLMTRRLEKYPRDFLAHYNLGALYETQARHQDAARQLQAALHIDPAQPAARNALAAALASQGRNAEALKEWRETVRQNPDYSEAHYNLARALTVLDDAQGAIAEYRIYLEQNPKDAGAHLNLGNIYIMLRQFPNAIPEYAKACDLDPANADALTNYGTLLANTGDLSRAIESFQAALRIDPANETALKNLNKAKNSIH